MTRVVVVTALLFIAAAAALIGYKVVALGYELDPRPADDRWSVQTEVRLVGAVEKAKVTFFLPADGPSQKIYDERVTAEGMRFFIRPRDGNRMGVAVGHATNGTISYRFSLQTLPASSAELPGSAAALSAEEERQYEGELGPEEAIQSDAPLLSHLIEELAIQRDDRAVALRQIHTFLREEVETTDGHDGPQDALAVLERERGGPQGRARAEVALLRAVRIPARVVAGVPISTGQDKALAYWVEARLEGRWWQLDPAHLLTGALPEPRLVLHRGDSPALEATGVETIHYRVSMLAEERSQYLAYQRRAASSGRLLDQLSLHSLPVKTQLLYRVLLLVPLGALVVAFFRNVIGVPTFGTFMPILISLAFRESGIGWGLLLLCVVIGIGYLGRFLLDKAQLLMVPRLSFLLTLVILIMAAVLVAAERLGSDRALSVALFPIVIITMTIERLSITIVEEGARNAAKVALGTVVVAIAGYVVIANDSLQGFVFTFPEIHLVTLAVLLLLGRYTGYRLSEWFRFRAFRAGGSEPGPGGMPGVAP